MDIEKNFAPCYEVSAEKKKVVEELSKLAKKVDAVWLASDEDRGYWCTDYGNALCKRVDGCR